MIKKEKLNEEELFALREELNTYRKSNRKLPLLFIFPVIISIAISFFLNWILGLIVFSILLFFPFFGYFSFKKIVNQLNFDIESGEKTVLYGILEYKKAFSSKNGDGYILLVDEESFEVSKEDYNKVEEKDSVKIKHSTKFKKVFKVEKI